MSRINEISKKYQPIIEQEFSDYVNLSKHKDMNEDIFFLSNNECVRDYKDLIQNTGKCDFDTGNIYINADKFYSYSPTMQERTIVHEYLHRLSRRKKLFIWMEGIHKRNDLKSVLPNEIITEYLTSFRMGKPPLPMVV